MSSYHTLDVHTIGNILDRSDDAINQTGEHKLSIFAASNDVSPETPQSAEVVFHICSAINRSTHERSVIYLSCHDRKQPCALQAIPTNLPPRLHDFPPYITLIVC